MSDSYARLERLARAAEDAPVPVPESIIPDLTERVSRTTHWHRCQEEFREAASPTAILALISRLRKLEAVAQAAREYIQDDSISEHALERALEALDREEQSESHDREENA